MARRKSGQAFRQPAHPSKATERLRRGPVVEVAGLLPDGVWSVLAHGSIVETRRTIFAAVLVRQHYETGIWHEVSRVTVDASGGPLLSVRDAEKRIVELVRHRATEGLGGGSTED